MSAYRDIYQLLHDMVEQAPENATAADVAWRVYGTVQLSDEADKGSASIMLLDLLRDFIEIQYSDEIASSL